MNKHALLAIMFLLGVSTLYNPLMAQSDTTERGEISSNTDSKKEKPESEIKTLFGKNKVVHGGYGGASAVYSEFNGQGALLVGGKGGWIINHTISLGMGGYGMTNNVYFNDIVPEERVNLNGGYGGLLIEFYVFPKQPVHLAFPILIGAGGMAYHIDRELDPNQTVDENIEDRRYLFVDDDAFFVLEPGVELEMNVLKNFRVALGASYRYLGDLQLEGTKSDAFDGIAAGISFKFGRF